MVKIPDSVGFLELCARVIADQEGRAAAVSDYRLAQVFEVRQQTISQIRRKLTTIGQPMALKVAEILSLSPGFVLACIQAERAQNERQRNAWQDAARKLASVLIVLGILAWAVPLVGAAGESDRFIHYAQALGKALAAWLIRRGWGLAIQGGLSWRPYPPVPQAV